LKVLNQPKYGEIFKKEHSYFEENQLIPYYKIFCQFTKIFNFNIKEISLKDFISRVKDYFIANSAGIGIGELCKSLAEKIDFSEENIEKIYNMMQQYNIKGIDTDKIGKQCRTTGIILFMIKDALVYCGLEANEKKNKKSQNFSEKKSLIEQNVDFNEMLLVSNRVLEKLKNSKSIIH
jgi:carbamoylphosphate synthase small subunit